MLDFDCEKHKQTKDYIRGMTDALEKMLQNIDEAISQRKSMKLYDSENLSDEDHEAIDHQHRAYDILSQQCISCRIDECLVWDFETLYFATLCDRSLQEELIKESRCRCETDEFVRMELLSGETLEEIIFRIGQFHERYL